MTYIIKVKKKGGIIVDKVRYMISDAANIVGVETHVLRYWEEELDLTIPRNEMGHRYYTRENIEEFQKIKNLKEQGYQLKEIKLILHGRKPEEILAAFQSAREKNNSSLATAESRPVITRELTAEDRMAQFRELMSDIVGHAISINNEDLSQQLGEEKHERILKEMNYLMREQDSAQEERYKKLDNAIRGSIHKKGFLIQKSEVPRKNKKHGRKHLAAMEGN